jgi:hypothetical protein
MAAYEIPNMRFSAEAGEQVERRRFVKINEDEKGVTAGAGESVIGVSMVDAAKGEVLEIANGIVMVEAAELINAGSEVQSDENGKAISAPTEGAGSVAGVAMTKASGDGVLVTIMIK